MKRTARPGTTAITQAASKPVAGSLFTEHAIDQFVEMLMSFPDPDEVLSKAGKSRTELRRLEGDDEVSTALETRLNAVAATPWRLEPGTGKDYDELFPQVQRHISQIVSGAWAAVPYGYSVMEATYRKGDRGRIEWATIRHKPFEWFAPRPWSQKNRNDIEAIASIQALGYPLPTCGLSYFPASGNVSIGGENVHLTAPGKFFVTRRRATDDRNPYGESLLSRLYWPWYFRSSGWKFWARFLERFGSPLLIGKTPNSTTEMAQALSMAIQSAVCAIGKDDDVEAVSPGNAGDSFNRFSEAIDKRIQKVILGQTLTTDINGKGSYAAAKVHDGVRDDRRMADVRMIQPTVQDMIDTLLVINGRKPGDVLFVLEDDVGLQPDRAERDSKLANAGIVRFTPEYLLRAYDFEEGDFEIPESAPDKPEGLPGKPKPKPAPEDEEGDDAEAKASAKASLLLASVADRAHFTPAQRAIEALGDGAIKAAGQPIAPAKIADAIRASSGPEELAERLADLFDGNDPEQFREVLERALFAADVMGYAHQEAQD